MFDFEKAPFETTQKYDFVEGTDYAAASHRLINVEADENTDDDYGNKGIELQRSIGWFHHPNAIQRNTKRNAKLLDQGENLINHRAVDIFLASKTPHQKSKKNSSIRFLFVFPKRPRHPCPAFSASYYVFCIMQTWTHHRE